MKILIDENISYACKLFSRFGKVKTIPGRQISKTELSDIDALIVRSVTQVNKTLLIDTPVKFVGTATAGIDHIDHKWLKQVGIEFFAASGCNAISVVEYVISALFILAERNNFKLKDRTIGIIGAGNIGKCLQQRLATLEVRTLICDPPRANRGDKEDFYSLDELVEEADILTFHTPLHIDGPYKTFHLADEKLIKRLRPGSILINTCRGSVVDNNALLTCLASGQDFNVVLDVWESEPKLNAALLKKIDIGTAHIAGYTLESKIIGTKKVFEAFSVFIGQPQKVLVNTLLPKPKFSNIVLHGLLDERTLKNLVHLVYDVRCDDALLRKAIAISGEFDGLRKNYFERREWSSLNIGCDNTETALMLCKLGFKTFNM